MGLSIPKFRNLIISGQGLTSPLAIAKAKEIFASVSFVSGLQEIELSSMREGDVVWIHLDSLFTDAMARDLGTGCLVVTPTTGLTHISDAAQKALGDNLVSLRGHNDFLEEITSTAELAHALTISALTNVFSASKDVLSGAWSRQQNFRHQQVSRSTLGIVGYGRLGRIAARLASPCFKDIVIYDISHERMEAAQQDGYATVGSVAEVFETSNAIQLHASVLGRVGPIVTEAELNTIETAAVLTNTSRGCLVAEEDIISALRSGKLSWYSADVLEAEDYDFDVGDSKLLTAFRNGGPLTLTPHIGGASKDAIERVELFLLKKIWGRLSTYHNV